LRIPLIYIRDKQAFRKEGGRLRMAGKPISIAKKLKDGGAKLIHVVDLDALKGSSTNLDIYDKLTYFINVEVECAPQEELVKSLLTLKCRVVLSPGGLDLSKIREKGLLVAKLQKDFRGSVGDFRDVILEGPDRESLKRFSSLGKRIIVYETDYGKLEAGNRKMVWGVISASLAS